MSKELTSEQAQALNAAETKIRLAKNANALENAQEKLNALVKQYMNNDYNVSGLRRRNSFGSRNFNNNNANNNNNNANNNNNNANNNNANNNNNNANNNNNNANNNNNNANNNANNNNANNNNNNNNYINSNTLTEYENKIMSNMIRNGRNGDEDAIIDLQTKKDYTNNAARQIVSKIRKILNSANGGKRKIRKTRKNKKTRKTRKNKKTNRN